MESPDRYWLYRVIEELELVNREDMRDFLMSDPMRARMIDIAVDEIRKPVLDPDPDGHSIVAGSTMDLSGTLTCLDYNCRRIQVDRLFAKTAHYFDAIVVEGRSAGAFMEMLDPEGYRDPRDAVFTAFDRIADDLRMLLHLIELGVDQLLFFHEKPYRDCVDHARKHADELGIAKLFDASVAKSVVDQVVTAANIEIVDYDDEIWLIPITDPLTENTYNSHIHKGRGRKPSKRQAVQKMLQEQAGVLVSDFALSQHLGLPLAQEGTFQWSPTGRRMPLTPQNVALELSLPVLSGLPPSDIVKLRQDEHDAFESFRSAITKAMQEQISRSDDEDPKRVAHDVVDEYVRPELATIERRFRSARQAMSSKSAVSLIVGSMATTVGVTSAVPLITTTGVAAAATVIKHLSDYIDRRSEIKLNDMYFLWRASRACAR